MDIAGQFGDKVARLRRQALISQEELAIRASLHRTEISQVERGLRVPRIDTLAKLCGGLELDPAELMAGIEWSPGGVRYGHFKEERPSDG